MTQLQDKRRASGMSQSELAKAAEMSVRTLQALEVGARNIDKVSVRGHSRLVGVIWNVFRHNFHIRTYTRRLCAGSTPAAGSGQPRRTLYLALCGAFLIGTIIRLEMFVGTLRRLLEPLGRPYQRVHDDTLSA